jgi:sugar fermentation stimulation protein A
MRFAEPLTEGRLVRRYKRFLADVAFLDGRVETVHCANPGAMTGVAEPGMRIFLSRSAKASRKLPWSWELVETGGALIGINTIHPNRLAAEGITTSAVAELDGYDALRREVRYGLRSRVDLVLTAAGRPDAYVEVKNAHLSRTRGLAEFPDSVTQRGARHLAELSRVVANGGRAAMLYVIQRTDADRFAVARDLDPAYGAAFDRARTAGVEMLAYACELSRDEILIARAVPIMD